MFSDGLLTNFKGIMFNVLLLGHLAMYEEWCKTFDPEQHKGEISELLVNVPEIRALYAKLVGASLFVYR